MITPLTKKNPLEYLATLVEEANTFAPGQFITATSGGRVLADNTDRDTPARAWVAAAEPDRYWIIAARGEIVEWLDHGFAVGSRRWLDTAGGTTGTEPGGSSVEVVQVVLHVWDEDHVQLFPETPITF